MSRGAAVEDASRGGPTDGTAFVLIIGRADRFQCGQQIASYLGLIPLEESSGERRRLGHITKPGNSRLRFLLVEAVQVTVRRNPPSDVVFPSNFRRLLIEYQEHPEAKSLAPDGTLCKGDTRGLLKRAHIVAGDLRYVGKEQGPPRRGGCMTQKLCEQSVG